MFSSLKGILPAIAAMTLTAPESKPTRKHFSGIIMPSKQFKKRKARMKMQKQSRKINRK